MLPSLRECLARPRDTRVFIIARVEGSASQTWLLNPGARSFEAKEASPSGEGRGKGVGFRAPPITPSTDHTIFSIGIHGGLRE